MNDLTKLVAQYQDARDKYVNGRLSKKTYMQYERMEKILARVERLGLTDEFIEIVNA